MMEECMMEKFRKLAHLTLAAMVAAVAMSGVLIGAVLVEPVIAQTLTYPDATNTGVPAGTALTVVNGDVTISTAGMIYENKDVRGCITVNAANVIIRKSKVL